MLTRFAALCVLALMVVAAPAAGQEGAGEGRVDLRGRLAPGDERRFEMAIDTQLRLRAPGPAGGGGDAAPAAGPAGMVEQNQSAHQWVDFLIRVVESGEAESVLELEYAGLRYTLESPNQAGAFDSTAPEADGEMARALRPVVGTRLVVRVSREGKVTQVSGGERLGGVPADEGQGGAKQEAGEGAFWPRVAVQFRERAIVASFVEPILTTRHPTGAAAVGETWTYSDRLDESPLGTFTIVTEYRLESADAGAGTAVLALSGRITAEPDAAGERAPFELMASTNQGRMVWSTAAGVLDSLEQTQSVDLRTSMQGVAMDLVNSTTVKLTRTK